VCASAYVRLALLQLSPIPDEGCVCIYASIFKYMNIWILVFKFVMNINCNVMLMRSVAHNLGFCNDANRTQSHQNETAGGLLERNSHSK
jgi:hypothetical protein